MAQSQFRQGIPTHLTLEQFEEFVLPHLHMGTRGPQPRLALHVIFNYILKLLYLGCQWKELPIEKNFKGRPEIHYTRIYRAFRRFEAHGCFDAIFAGSVSQLHQKEYLDISVIHGDGTTTAAKKGSDNLGFSGHKQMKGDKVVAFCDRHCNVIAPFIAAPGNHHESPLLLLALPQVSRIAKHVGLALNKTIVSLDAAGAIVERTAKPFSIVAWFPILLKICAGGRLISVDANLFLTGLSIRRDFSRLSECSPGKISFGAYCCALNESASCTMP
jgi:transposase